MIALFLMMRPLSWYQFCVSLPLEVRTVGLVLFLQVLTLLFYTGCRQPVMLNLCSVTTCSVQSCVATTVNYITQRRKCCLLPLPPMSVSGNRCHTSPLPPADQEEEGRMSGGKSKPSVTFTVSIQLSSLTLTSVNTTPLPYHLHLHPVTLVLPQLKTYSFSASLMQDPSAHSGGSLTYPPSFGTLTSTSCC